MDPSNCYTHLCRYVSCMLFTLVSLVAFGPPASAGPTDKVQICHIPPGNPTNFHTITVNQKAVDEHLAHGDKLGACGAHCESLCNDGNACTVDRCLPGTETCQPPAQRPAVDCNDSETCTTDSCNPASGCVYTPRTGASCSDGNDCTGSDQCNASGQCGGTPITGCCLNNADCNDDKACTVDTCNLATKTCTNTEKNCADTNACTVDACDPLSGACVHPPKDCDDNNPCTADSCDSSGTCVHTPVPTGTSCSDGNACNGAETCQSGVCTGPVTTFTCDDHNPCTTDTCTPLGGCASTPVANGTACDDNNVCTVTSTCFNGTCSQFTAQRCDSGWGLGDASACDPVTGCQTQCPAYFPQRNGEPDKCQPLDQAATDAQGSCIYQPVNCQADGCYFQECNQNTGLCEHSAIDRNRFCEADPCSVPSGGCPDLSCSIVTCDLTRKDVPNCGTEVPYSCSVPGVCSGGTNAGAECDETLCNLPPPNSLCACRQGGGTCVPRNFCQIRDVNANTVPFGCSEGYGCTYTAPRCAETKPLGEPGNCQEYFENPSEPGCCDLRPKVCRASDFGLPANTTGYTFACDEGTGDCVAMPQ